MGVSVGEDEGGEGEFDAGAGKFTAKVGGRENKTGCEGAKLVFTEKGILAYS